MHQEAPLLDQSLILLYILGRLKNLHQFLIHLLSELGTGPCIPRISCESSLIAWLDTRRERKYSRYCTLRIVLDSQPVFEFLKV